MTAADSLLITPAALAAATGPSLPVVLDVRWRLGGPPGIGSYREGHLPGAVFIDLDRDLSGPAGPGGRHPLPETERFQAAMRAAGVSHGRPVVVYDDGDSLPAARAWWMLRYYGHEDVRVLDGGYRAWLAAGLAVTTAEQAQAPGDFTARPGQLPVLDASAAAELARTGLLLDVRAAERYRGEKESVDPVAGHIPGAVSAPAAGNLTSGGTFKASAELAAGFAALGAGPGVRVGAYCGSGVTAAQEVLALTLAGIPAALYVGSWSDWITDPARPVATGPQLTRRPAAPRRRPSGPATCRQFARSMPVTPRRRNVRASAASAAAAITTIVAARRASDSQSGRTGTGVPDPVNTDRLTAEPTRGGSASAQAAPAVTASSTAGNVSISTSLVVRCMPMVVSLASVSARSADPSATPSIRMNRPNPAEVATVSGRMRLAPCCSGELARAASAAERNAMLAPGSALDTTADIAALSIPDPVISNWLTPGTPAVPGRRRTGMTRNALPGGWAGTLASVPAIRTLIGPTSSCEVSCAPDTAPARPSAAAAAGEASTDNGPAPDGCPPSRATGMAGNGVLATRAA
jgi:thiosulfate/3-mercaptopyruvate sulfurtransferase